MHNWHFVVTASQKWKSYSTTCTRIFDSPHLRPVTAHRVQGLQELTSILLTTTDLSHNPLLSQAAHTLSALLTRCFHTLCGSLHVGMIVKSSCLNCQSFIFSRLLRICLLPGDFTSPNAFDLFNSIIHLKCKFVL